MRLFEYWRSSYKLAASHRQDYLNLLTEYPLEILVTLILAITVLFGILSIGLKFFRR